MEVSPRRVSYYYDPDIGCFSYGQPHPMKPLRMRITHELLTAYDLLPRLDVMRAKRATPEMMTAFHTDEYVHFLNRVTPDTAEALTYQGTRFLMGDDNPAFEGIFEFCSISAGGTIAAAQRLTSGLSDIAINWAGGLHHAKKREASGFCYINDIVLGILELLKHFPRVLYVDIDCHHGDGVEEAFYTTDRVLTCSFHKFGDYFPGTGTIEDRGTGAGRGYAVNVPLKDGLGDESFKTIFEPVIQAILDRFQPSAIVLQCGSDSLSGDKLGCFNITMHGHASAVQFLRRFNIPMILVGGGGYTVKNASRTWAFETACALGVEDQLDPRLPWNEFFEWFGPRYRLEVVASNVEDLNLRDDEGSLKQVMKDVLKNIHDLPPVPSVQLQDVPRQDLGEHLGLWNNDDQLSKDELDEKLAQQAAYTYSLKDPTNRPDGFEPSSSSDPEPESDTSTYSSQRRRRQRVRQARKARAKPRMSIISNSWYDVPPLDHFGFYDYGESERVNGGGQGKGSEKGKGKMLWDSGARWDMASGRVVVQEALDFRLSVGEMMGRGPNGEPYYEDMGGEDDEDEGETESDGDEDDEVVKHEEEEEETMDEDDE